MNRRDCIEHRVREERKAQSIAKLALVVYYLFVFTYLVLGNSPGIWNRIGRSWSIWKNTLNLAIQEFVMSKSIVELVDNLPSGGVTVMMLKSLDFVVPGEWNNLTGFDNTIQAVTGETKRKLVEKIRDRAIELYANPNEPYQGVVRLYQLADSADSALGATAMASKIGENIGFLSFLNRLTPKADTTQTIDLCVKVAIELIAFCKLKLFTI